MSVCGSNPDRARSFLFSYTSRPPLGPNQPSVQWVLALCRKVKRPGRDYNSLPPTLGSEFDTHRMLVFMIWINVLHIYNVLSVSGELVANRASSAAQPTAYPAALS